MPLCFIFLLKPPLTNSNKLKNSSYDSPHLLFWTNLPWRKTRCITEERRLPRPDICFPLLAPVYKIIIAFIRGKHHPITKPLPPTFHFFFHIPTYFWTFHSTLPPPLFSQHRTNLLKLLTPNHHSRKISSLCSLPVMKVPARIHQAKQLQLKSKVQPNEFSHA